MKSDLCNKVISTSSEYRFQLCSSQTNSMIKHNWSQLKKYLSRLVWNADYLRKIHIWISNANLWRRNLMEIKKNFIWKWFDLEWFKISLWKKFLPVKFTNEFRHKLKASKRNVSCERSKCPFKYLIINFSINLKT